MPGEDRSRTGHCGVLPNRTPDRWTITIAWRVYGSHRRAVRRPWEVAGATTLIVGLGLLHTPAQLVVAAAAVVLVTAVDRVYNRATGTGMPLWSAGTPEEARHG